MRHPCLLLLSILVALFPSYGQPQTIDTIAGGGPPDGVHAGTAWYDMADMAVDAEGNIYFPSRRDHRIYKIDTSGIVHHVAGTGIEQPLGDGGPAGRASFFLPTSLALTSESDLIVYGSGEFQAIYDMPPPPLGRRSLRLRRIDTDTGLVSTIAGNGGWGLTRGPVAAEEAALTLPWDLHISPSGDLFLSGIFTVTYSEDSLAAIHRIDQASGMLQLVAGGGGNLADGIPAIQAAFYEPGPQLALGPSGLLFASDYITGRVRIIDLATGIIDTIAGNGTRGDTGDGGPALEAEIMPFSMLLNSEGDLFISTETRVRVVDADTGIIETVAGNGTLGTSGDGGPATDASVKAVHLGFDRDENLYIAGLGDIRMVDAATGIISTIVRQPDVDPWGDGGPADEARLGNPLDLALSPNGDLYIAESARIRKVEADTGLISTPLPFFSALPVLGGVAWHPDGGLYYSTYPTIGGLAGIYGSSAVWRLDPQGGSVRVSGDFFPGYDGDGGPAIDATLDSPTGLAIDVDGNLFVADTGNHVIRRIDGSTGIITTYAGGGMPGELGDGGPATEAWLGGPVALAVDPLGHLLIGIPGQNRVRRVDARTGVIETIAGSGEPGTTGDGGPATEAGIDISRIALDQDGNLYISGDERVRMVQEATGLIHTIAGDGTLGFYGDGGPPLQAALGGPRGMSIDENGDLLIAAFDARRVRRVGPGPGIRVAAEPSVLSRSHELVDIMAMVEGTRGFVPAEIILESVSSNEADDAHGGSDGHTIGDIQGADIGEADFSFMLRAERDARGRGRVYTIRYMAVDTGGIEKHGETRVVVPHNGPKSR